LHQRGGTSFEPCPLANREIAVRLAIGAGRFRLIRMLLTESLILASLGGVAGSHRVRIVQWFQSFQNVIFMTDLPFSIPFRMDTRVLLASLALSALSALLCGLAPGAAGHARGTLVNGLKSADVDVPGRKRCGPDCAGVAQVSTPLMLLTASFLMVRGFQHTLWRIPVSRKTICFMASFDPRLMQYSAAQTQQFYKLLAERVRQAPGVQSEALTRTFR